MLLLLVQHGGLSPVNSLAWWLRQEHPGSSWITERELRRDVFRRRRGEDGLLRHAQEPRTPDGMLVLAEGTKNTRVAVELERRRASSTGPS